MTISRAWTGAERLYVIACCATVVLRHMKKGGRYGEPRMPNMETMRGLVQESAESLEGGREEVEMLIAKSRRKPSDEAGDLDVCERLEAIAACATVARNHAMRGGAYGANGIPTLDLILLLATAPNAKIDWVEIENYKRRWTKDPRTGQQALADEVTKFLEGGIPGDN